MLNPEPLRAADVAWKMENETRCCLLFLLLLLPLFFVVVILIVVVAACVKTHERCAKKKSNDWRSENPADKVRVTWIECWMVLVFSVFCLAFWSVFTKSVCNEFGAVAVDMC